MAKVIPGPLAAKVSGAVGPVVYYEAIGRAIVRARVRPHQKITSARYFIRQNWQFAMDVWRNVNNFVKPSWNDVAYPQRHGVNAFLWDVHHRSTPWLYIWPPHPLGEFAFSWCYEPFGIYRKWRFTWDPADFPPDADLLFHPTDQPNNQGYGYEHRAASYGYVDINTKEKDYSWWVAVRERFGNQYANTDRQVKRIPWAQQVTCNGWP